MARRWVERDHPRHPGGSPGGTGGRFRETIGGAGWAARLSSMLSGRRGITEYLEVHGPAQRARQRPGEVQPRAGTFIGNVPSTHGNARPQPEHKEHEVDAAELIDSGQYAPGEWEVYNPESGEWEVFQGGESSGVGRGGVEPVTGFVETSGDGFYISAMPDLEDFDGDEDDEDYQHALQSWEEFGDVRVRPAGRSPRRGPTTEERTASSTEAIRVLEQRGPASDEAHASLDRPRLTSQEVADALAPQRRIKPLTKQGERDAEWIEGFEEGVEWESTFRPNREAELVAHGVLIPTGRPGIFRVGRRRM